MAQAVIGARRVNLGGRKHMNVRIPPQTTRRGIAGGLVDARKDDRGVLR